jgi:protein O-mannosyl-transferase
MVMLIFDNFYYCMNSTTFQPDIFNKQLSYWAVAFFISILGVTLLVYAQGWSGGWHFDDDANLGALAKVFAQGRMDADTAFEFVFSGDAGPLGRSLALASFLIDGSAWPHDPRAMLYTNSLLHAMNGLLLWGVLFNLGRSRAWQQSKSAWLAGLSAGLWLLLPLSVSGVLMAVQRMAVLSCSFMLLGLWVYLLGRQRLGQNGWSSWLRMTAGLGLGTLLGVFTKEQAAILPLLVWVLEGCWLPRPVLTQATQRHWWQAFKALFFYLPALVIAAYLLRIVWNAEGNYTLRNYDLGQRLWTQAVILWDYLRLAFMPRAVAFGPFHDDYTIYDSSHWLAWIAVGGWMLAGVAAWLLRHTTRLPLFALLWFAVAHLIESTVVPLELYFEHRNYLALAIPMFALMVAVWHWAERRNADFANRSGMPVWRVLGLGVGAYTLMLAMVLWQTTSLFGQPPLAAQRWYEQHPSSIRAAQFFAQNLVVHNNVPGALQVLDTTAQRRPNAGSLSLQGLQLACVLDHPRVELQKRLDLVLYELPLAPQRFSIMQTLDKLKTLHQNKNCKNFIQQENLLAIAQAALINPRISGMAQERSNLHVFMASLFMDAKQLDPTMEHLLAALDAVPSLQNLQIAAIVLKSAGIGEEMTEILARHPIKYPRNPWLKQRLEKEWQALQKQSNNQR